MAEEIIVPTTPEISKSNGDDSRRKSPGNPNSSNSGGKIIPHYLRASTGSCHDNCKYGNHHTFETNARRPIRKRFIRPPPAPDGGNEAEIVVLVDRKKTVIDKFKPLSDSETVITDSTKIVKREKKASLKLKPLSDSESVIADSTQIVKREKKASLKLKPSSDSGTVIADSTKIVKREKKASLKLKPSSDSGTIIADSTKIVNREKKATLKPKSSSDSKTLSAESSKIITREVSAPSMNLEVPLKRVASNTKETILSAKLPSSLKPKPTTVKSLSSPNFSTGSSGRRNRIANNAKDSNVLVKHAISLKPKSLTVNSLSSSNASEGSSGGRDINIKIGKKTGTSRVAVKKVLAPPIASLSSKPSFSRVASLNARKTKTLKSVPPLKNQNRIRSAEPKQPSNEKVQEKTLYVIKMETENKTSVSVENRCSDEKNTLEVVDNSSLDENKTHVSVENRSPDGNQTLESAGNGSATVRLTPSSSSLLSPKAASSSTSPSLSSHEEDDLEASEYTDSEVDESISEDNETVDMNKTETLEGEYRRRRRKAGLVLSEDRDGNPVKLSFRRGKVVDLQSEINSPRRLRFRRGRVLGENQIVKGDARRRHFKKREEADANGANPGSEIVILRHQDVQGKKDTLGLFNNVIEETASKLSERRSKVKALVGAFETVISLQDSKPTTNTIS